MKSRCGKSMSGVDSSTIHMLHINLFHEQLLHERARRFDPVRWTWVLGAFILAILLFWMETQYWNLHKIKTRHVQVKTTHDQLKAEIETLKASDAGKLPQIEKDLHLLEGRTREHLRVATLLDILIAVMPQNVQITQLNFNNEVVEEKIPAPATPKNPSPSPKSVLKVLSVLGLELTAEARTKVDALLERDTVVEILRKNPAWKSLLESPDVEVELVSTKAPDPLPGRNAQAYFVLKLPLKTRNLE